MTNEKSTTLPLHPTIQKQDATATIASKTFSAVSAPIQYTAVEAFNGNTEITTYLQNSKDILQTVGNYVFQKLLGLNITIPAPVGGFYFFSKN